MAVEFDNIDSKTYFSKGAPVVTAPPFSVFCRVNPSSVGPLGGTLINIERMPPGFGGYHHFQLRLESSDGQVHALSYGGHLGTNSSATAGPYSLNEWQTVGGVFTSHSSRQAYHNGIPGTLDTTACTAPSGLEDTLLGVSATVTVGTFNAPLNGCLSKAAIWSSALTDQNMLDLHDGVDPATISPSTLVYYAPLVDAATAVELFAWDGGAVTQTADLTLNFAAGGIADCLDVEPAPEPGETGEDECAEDFADELQTPITWPKCDLVPTSINIEVVSPTVSPGRSFTGREQIVQPDAGSWRITYGGVPIRTKTHAFQWREIESLLNGRNGSILVQVYEAKLSATPIAVIATNTFPIGATQLEISQSAGADIQAGMQFSAGEWLYRVMRIVEDLGDGVETVAIFPPLREAIAATASLDFNDPHCRCRLERHDSMSVNLELLRFARPSVTFVEDV